LLYYTITSKFKRYCSLNRDVRIAARKRKKRIKKRIKKKTKKCKSKSKKERNKKRDEEGRWEGGRGREGGGSNKNLFSMQHRCWVKKWSKTYLDIGNVN